MVEGAGVRRGQAERALLAASKVFAYAGGFVLICLVLMIVASIFGRGFFAYPIPGDFELVELGSAMVVVLFLPYCQITRNNVSLDMFVHRMSARALSITDALGNLLLALVAGVLAWRSALGGIELYETRDVTSLLQIPLWLAFPIIVASFVLLVLVSVLNLMTDMKGARA